MTTQQNNISGQLMDLDAPVGGTPRREEFDRRLRSLFDQKLSLADWTKFVLVGVGGLAGATICGLLVATEPAEMPTRTRVALGALTLIGLSWTAFAGVILRRGSINSAVHGTLAARMGFAYTLIATAAIAILSLSGASKATGAGILLLPIAALALAAVVLIVHHIRQAELRLRRDMLQIEYRVAKLAEIGEAAAPAK
jgi:hypothetical protein